MIRRALAALVLTLLFSGCAGAGLTGSASAPPAASITTAALRTAPGARAEHSAPLVGARAVHERRRPAPLVDSRASATVVQPQPAAGSCHARGSGLDQLPDPRCTPGALNPAVRPATLSSTICRAGWTATVRPPESVSEAEKFASMRAYGRTDSAGAYEYDHLVPLELGGAVNDARNLWPEPDYAVPQGYDHNPKDAIEYTLRNRVCAGSMSLAAAQRAIATDWVTAAGSPGPAGSAGATRASGSPTQPARPECQVERARFNRRYDDFDVVVHGRADSPASVSADGYSGSWHTDADGTADVFLRAPASLAGQTVTARVATSTCRGTLTATQQR
jgi:hypothetical protein